MADRTEYLIELAAKFTGGDTAAVELATLGDKMLAAGATAQDFDDVVKASNAALEDAAAAATAAADAVAVGQARYNEFETAADRAAKMVEKVTADLKEQETALARALDVGDAKQIERVENRVWALAQRQQDLVVKSNAAAAALKTEAAAMDVLNKKATTTAEKHAAVDKSLANVKAGAADAAKAAAAAQGTGKLGDMANAFGALGGPVGQAGQKVLGLAGSFKKLGSAMGSAGPYVAIALAIVAIATAAIVATVAITKWGVSLAEANRAQLQLSEGVAQSVAGGAQLNDKINALSKVVPSTREELQGMAADLAKTGLKGKELTDALEDSAVKAATLKFGPQFQKQMLALDVQSRKLGDNLHDTFGGLKIEGLLEGLSTLVALFDSSTASGRAMKAIFETFFQPLVDGAADAIPMIERLFLYAELYTLKALIALKPYRTEIEEIGKAMLVAAAIIGVIFAAAVAIVVGVVGLLFVIVADMVNTVYEWTAAFIALETVIVGALADALLWCVDIGKNIIKGLVSGITDGAAAVVDAMVGVVKGGVDAVTKFLKQGSPSKLFADIGENTALGYAEGVEGGTDKSNAALESMVTPPEGAPGGRGASGGLTLSIGQIIVSGENAKAQALDFVDQVTAWLESEGITLGGGEAAA